MKNRHPPAVNNFYEKAFYNPENCFVSSRIQREDKVQDKVQDKARDAYLHANLTQF